MAKEFNPEILVIARGARALSQSELAHEMKWSQGKGSKVENGLIQLGDDEIHQIAKLLNFPVDLFYLTDAIRGFGTCCLYHRKRAATTIRSLNQLHDVVNIRRIQISRLIKGVSQLIEPNFPVLNIDDYDSPEQIAQLVRATWGLPRGPVKNLSSVIESAGGLIFMMSLDTPKIDAVSQRAIGLPPIFFLDRNKPADRCRFTLAHELGHIVMHSSPSPNAEEEADRFASEFLMPAKEIKAELKGLTIAKAAVLKLRWRTSMQSIIRRAKDTGAITAQEYKSLYIRISQLGYRKDEPNQIAPELPTMINSIVALYQQEHNYSLKELSALTLCEESEFADVFMCSNSDAVRLRLVN